MSERLSADCYLVLQGRKSAYGHWELVIDRLVKTTTQTPKLAPGQIPILVTVALPRSLFEQPQLSVRIECDGDAVPHLEIDAATKEAMAERIKELVGVNVHVTAEAPDP